MAFQVKVPTGKGGGDSSGGSGSDMKETNKLLKKLDKTMILNIDVWEILSGVIRSVGRLFEPLIKVLGLLFMVIFLPLLPLIILLVKGIVGLIKLFTGGFGNIAKMLAKIILGLIMVILGVLLAPIAVGAAAIAAVILLIVAGLMMFGSEIWNFIKWLGGLIADAAVYIWEALVGFVQWFVDARRIVGEKILEWAVKLWGFFKAGFSKVVDWGGKIWDLIKMPFQWLGIKIKEMINGLIRAVNRMIPGGRFDIPYLANGGIVSSPTIAMIGEAGPEAVIPLNKLSGVGGTSVTINNPVVRSDADIKKLADQVSKAIQRKGNRGFSSL